MAPEVPHKFKKPVEIPYLDYIQASLSGEVSLFRELENSFGKEKAHKLIREWTLKKTIEGITKYLKETGVDIQSFEDFKQYMKKEWESEQLRGTHTYIIESDGPEHVSYTVTECIWKEAMEKLDATDLGILTMCDLDFETAPLYHPNIRLKRTKTLMNGDDCCDFTYVWEE
jgi:hypothetical protein